MTKTIVKGREFKDFVKFKVREDGKIAFYKIPFTNYFYVKSEDYDDISFLIRQHEKSSEIIIDKLGNQYTKIYLNNNTLRYRAKLIIENVGIEVFEGDINSVKRFFILNQKLNLHQDKLKYVFMDIETFDLTPLENDFKGNIYANEPITSFALKDSDGKIHFRRNKGLDDNIEYYRKLYNDNKKDLKVIQELREKLIDGEHELLAEYSKLIKMYDVALAWNGNRFDFTYIRQRMKKLDSSEIVLNYENLWLVDIDYKEIFKKNSWDSLKSYSLNNVALHTFRDEIEKENSKYDLSEVTKIDWREKTGLKKYFELFLFEPELFKDYNIQDVNLMYLMEQQLNFMKIQEVSAKLCHCDIFNTVWNSHMCDYLFLNEYHNRNIIRPSKPTPGEVEARIDPITGSYPGGGFTRCFLPGIHKNVKAYDFKSQYPTVMISYGISPETFVKNIRPPIEKMFDEHELRFIVLAVKSPKDFLNAKGLLRKAKYEKYIEDNRLEIQKNAGNGYVLKDMNDLMWHFTKVYEPKAILEYCKKNNYVATPADLNFDTRGWKFHPHRIFKREEGVMSKIVKFLISERDKAKYEKKEAITGSADWWAKEFYQLAIKTIANSMFGYTSFRMSREFSYDIPDSITAASRYHEKLAIIEARLQGFNVVTVDTDSAYLTGVDDITKLELDYYNLWNKVARQHNCDAKIELINPMTKEKEMQNHFIVFEHEKDYEVLLAIKKKRYYYKMVKK